jgi:hypothetical protein
MLDMAQHMNPRAYLTAEAKAWFVEEPWARLNQGKLRSLERFVLDEPAEEAFGRRITDGTASRGCLHCKCEEDAENFTGVYSASREEKQFWKVEDLGTESPYRCVDCRNCSKCRNVEELEAISFKEEAEQALIKASVQLDPRDHLVWARLPFTLDPVEHLKENIYCREGAEDTDGAF